MSVSSVVTRGFLFSNELLATAGYGSYGAQGAAQALDAEIRITPGPTGEPSVLYIGTDHSLQVVGLQNELTAAYANEATVTATLKHLNGIEVSGQNWPITLPYVAASDGNYRGTLEDALVLTYGKFYILEIEVNAGGGSIAFWRKELVAQYRSF